MARGARRARKGNVPDAAVGEQRVAAALLRDARDGGLLRGGPDDWRRIGWASISFCGGQEWRSCAVWHRMLRRGGTRALTPPPGGRKNALRKALLSFRAKFTRFVIARVNQICDTLSL